MAGKKLHGNAQEIWVSSPAIRRIFGVMDKTLRDRGVVCRKDSGRLEFELASFYDKCRDLIHKRLDEEFAGGELVEVAELKAEKLREEVRKLRLANDQEENMLVRADEVESEYSRAMKSVSDTLDGMLSQVKMRVPDLPQGALAAISDALAEARRKAARLDF